MNDQEELLFLALESALPKFRSKLELCRDEGNDYLFNESIVFCEYRYRRGPKSPSSLFASVYLEGGEIEFYSQICYGVLDSPFNEAVFTFSLADPHVKKQIRQLCRRMLKELE
jgi:hypothetical protein